MNINYPLGHPSNPCCPTCGTNTAELERVKQQLEQERAAKMQWAGNCRKAAEQRDRLLAALKDAEAMLSAGNEQGIGVIRAAIAATEQGGREIK